jgi:hypothetical protein
MLERIQTIVANLLYILLWVILAALVTFTLFQVHGTLISLGVYIVNDPSLRPLYWNSGSIILLSRLLWLVLGLIWLGSVIYMHEHLNEGRKVGDLWKRVLRILLIIAGIYGSSYLALLKLA